MTAQTAPSIGTEQMSFLMNPCGPDGRPVGGGNHYANAGTLEDARAYAARVLSADTFLGYTVWSVSIQGTLMRLGSYGWENVRSCPMTIEVIRSDRPVPRTPQAAGRACWHTTVMDYPEIIHELRADGSCTCGDPSRRP